MKNKNNLQLKRISNLSKKVRQELHRKGLPQGRVDTLPKSKLALSKELLKTETPRRASN